MTDLNERIDELVERERLVLMAAPGSSILGGLRHGIEVGLRERALPPEVRDLVEACRGLRDLWPRSAQEALAAVEALEGEP